MKAPMDLAIPLPAPIHMAARFAPLRTELADDLAQAKGWSDLQRRMNRRGYCLVRTGGGLGLETMSGKRLCNLADIGHSYVQLVRRFGGPIAPAGQALALVG